MQIRIWKKKVQLLRSSYAPEKKRSTQKIIATFDADRDSVPHDVLELLKPHEKTQLHDWMTDRKHREWLDRMSHTLKHLPQTLQIASEAIESNERGINRGRANDIYGAIDAFTKKLRKIGFPREKRKKEPQADLNRLDTEG